MGEAEKTGRIEIRPTGSYFEVDADGFLINPAAPEKIQERWKPVVSDVVAAYQTAYGDHLRSVYVRGSVAKGEAIDGVADLDSFAYVDLPKEQIKHDWVDEEEKRLRDAYPFVEGVEMGASPVSDIEGDAVILGQSACVWGEQAPAPKLRIGRNLAIHAPRFHKRLERLRKLLGGDEGEAEVKRGCAWIAKAMLRVGFEITMERANRYTRDLYRCYETFAEFYPEKEAEMRHVLDLALNPTSDKAEIAAMLDGIGEWLLAESKKVDWKG